MRKVDAYIDGLPEEKSILVSLIRELIMESVPEVEEKLSFKIPFYHYFGMFCYINPVENGVNLVFCRGKDLIDAFPILERQGRAIMASVTITDKKDIAKYSLRHLIETAAAWNEEAKRLKIPLVTVRKKKARKK